MGSWCTSFFLLLDLMQGLLRLDPNRSFDPPWALGRIFWIVELLPLSPRVPVSFRFLHFLQGPLRLNLGWTRSSRRGLCKERVSPKLIIFYCVAGPSVYLPLGFFCKLSHLLSVSPCAYFFLFIYWLGPLRLDPDRCFDPPRPLRLIF